MDKLNGDRARGVSAATALAVIIGLAGQAVEGVMHHDKVLKSTGALFFL